jgi:hypothetical protein
LYGGADPRKFDSSMFVSKGGGLKCPLGCAIFEILKLSV